MSGEILLPLIGGILIGLASSLMLFGLGRITGISGIFSQALVSFSKQSWRLIFVVGLILGGVMMLVIQPEFFDYEIKAPLFLVIIGGLLVGYGTRLGSGCTSGHGVCGLPRRSLRSFVATMTFMLFGIMTVLVKGFFL